MTDSLIAKSIMKENLYIVMAGFGLLVVLAVFFYVAYQSMSVGGGSATSSQHNKVSDQITEVLAMPESRYRKAYLENAAHVLQDNRLTIIEYRYMQSNYHTLLEREGVKNKKKMHEGITAAHEKEVIK